MHDEGATQPWIEVSGAMTDDDRERIRRRALRAASALALDGLRIDVVDPRGVPRWIEAAAEPNGIWFRPHFLKQDPLRLDSVLYEEAAHYKLLHMGIKDERTFAGALIQELFAAWFETRQILTDPSYERKGMIAYPLPPPRYEPGFAYQLGTALGAALGGHEEAARQVRKWFADGNVDPALKRIARRFERIVVRGGTPSEVAERLVREYRAFGLDP